MAFTILVLALAVLSFGIFNDEPAGPTQVSVEKADILYYSKGEIDDKGEILIDNRKIKFLSSIPLLGYQEYKISKGKPYPTAANVKIDDPSFQMVSAPQFLKLKTSLPLNLLPGATCEQTKKFHENGIYAQLGYSLYAIKGVDAAPSITYILANYPKSYVTKFLDSEGNTNVTVTPPTCVGVDVDNDKYFEFAVHKGGFVGADCIPNVDIPDDTTKCSEGSSGQYLKYFENYKQAVFKGTTDTIKNVLIKFGAVRLFDGTVIIGWDAENNWVTVKELTDLLPVEDIYPILYQYTLSTKPISTYTGEVQGYVFNNGFKALRAAVGLIAAVLMLPALLL